MKDRADIDHELFDRTGSIYTQPLDLGNFNEEFEKLGDDKPAEPVTGGTFAVVENEQ